MRPHYGHAPETCQTAHKSRYRDSLMRRLPAQALGQRPIRELGRKYKRISNPAVLRGARELYRSCDKALLLLDYLEAGLLLRLQLRRIWNRDNSDLIEFWKLRFESIYSRLEDATKKLAFLVEPGLSERFAKRLAVQRPLLALPTNAEDAARVALQRFKSMMWALVPMNAAATEGEEFLGKMEKRSSEELEKIRAGLRRTIDRLPEAERELEMKEINELLDLRGY